MFKINDYVIYKRETCIVKDINKNYLNGVDYYVLNPIDDKTLTINIPSHGKISGLRKPISKAEIELIMQKISQIEEIEVENEKNLENEYKKLLKNDNHEDLIKIIKTTYKRNENKRLNNKKISDKDENYLKKAEQILYNEFSIVLNQSYEDIKKYIIDKV